MKQSSLEKSWQTTGLTESTGNANHIPTVKNLQYKITSNDSYDNLPGFDASLSKNWTYPDNLPIRKYQFEIVQNALFRNTLVCLPTGLGKTFIAAVLMYNFLRWYPEKICIFIAPTRPLVHQQMECCKKFTGIPSTITVELTGNTYQQQRKYAWEKNRLFFLTPQVLANDIEANILDIRKLCCLVFDEAHKATGNHAYCKVVHLITSSEHNYRQFRVLALSATPSSSFDGLQNVVANLLISHIELRTEDSKDIREYTHNRNLEVVIVPLSEEIVEIQDIFLALVNVHLQRLNQVGAISNYHLDPFNLSPFILLQAKQKYFTNIPISNAGEIWHDFELSNFYVHALELLTNHGLKSLYHYLSDIFKGIKGSISLRNDVHKCLKLSELWNNLQLQFSCSPSRSISLTQKPFVSGHPKLKTLKDLLLQHFMDTARENSRAIVFTQYRDSVDEIMHMLKQMRPTVKAVSFIGQSSTLANSRENNLSMSSRGITQKDQLRIMKSFKEGVFNTLVSTSIGEEGIDVGQVDIIICFDATKSPIRLIQRLGRTGRSRTGKIFMLLSDGQERRTYEKSQQRSKSMNEALTSGRLLKDLSLYPHNPRMVPLCYDPTPSLQTIEVQEDDGPLDGLFMNRTSRLSDKLNIVDLISSHGEAFGVKNSENFCLYSCGPLMTRPQASNLDKITLTSIRPKIISRPLLAYTREDFQTILPFVGSSVCTINFVYCLRLSYLALKKLTGIDLYSMGIRSLDMSNSFSTFLDEYHDAPAQSQLLPVIDGVKNTSDVFHVPITEIKEERIMLKKCKAKLGSLSHQPVFDIKKFAVMINEYDMKSFDYKCLDFDELEHDLSRLFEEPDEYDEGFNNSENVNDDIMLDLTSDQWDDDEVKHDMPSPKHHVNEHLVLEKKKPYDTATSFNTSIFCTPMHKSSPLKCSTVLPVKCPASNIPTRDASTFMLQAFCLSSERKSDNDNAQLQSFTDLLDSPCHSDNECSSVNNAECRSSVENNGDFSMFGPTWSPTECQEADKNRSNDKPITLNNFTNLLDENSEDEVEKCKILGDYVYSTPNVSSHSDESSHFEEIKPKFRNKIGRAFLLTQADHSKHNCTFSSHDEDLDAYESSFVVNSFHENEEENFLDESQMKEVYLKSLKSPIHCVQNRFKLKSKHSDNIFSQVPEQDDSDLDDFIVGNEVIEKEKKVYSPLTEALKRGKENRRKRKCDAGQVKRNRKVLCLDDS